MNLWIKNNKLILLGILLVGLLVGMLGSIYDPFLKVFAQVPTGNNYTIGILDRELKHVNEKFESFDKQLKGIREDIQNLSDQQINMRIKVAESAGVYGGLASLIVLLASFFGKILIKSTRNKS